MIFENRHLWIFSGAIASFPDDFKNGTICPIYSDSGEQLGSGYFHQGISLSGRILSVGVADPWEMVCSHLDRALSLRQALFDLKVTNAFRLVNGEGDLLPGLVIDQYADSLVLQSSTLGIDLLKERIVSFLAAKKRWKAIYEKSSSGSRQEEGLVSQIGVLWGEEEEEIPILENGLLFKIRWRKGQKTGFFLDQREMRKRVGEISAGKRVLNCFCYNGGFSLYALRGGALSVDSLDSSALAVSWAKEAVLENGFPLSSGEFLARDAFAFLREDPLSYDLLILDPPAFAKKRDDIPQATNGYREINFQAISKMKKGALLLTCSCSYYIDEKLFQSILFQAAKAAGRDVQIISKHILAPDHPVNLFHPESSYLKSFLLRVF